MLIFKTLESHVKVYKDYTTKYVSSTLPLLAQKFLHGVENRYSKGPPNTKVSFSKANLLLRTGALRHDYYTLLKLYYSLRVDPLFIKIF